MSSQEEVRLVKSVFGIEVILWFCVAVVKLLESNSRGWNQGGTDEANSVCKANKNVIADKVFISLIILR